MTRSTGFPAAVRQLIEERSGGVCERCTMERAKEIHHRAPRQIGGTRLAWINEASNGAHLCGTCHAHIESNRTEGYQKGWLIRRSGLALDPALVPVCTRDGDWYTLTNTGDKIPTTEGA